MKIAMIISTPFPPEEGIGYYTYNLSKNFIKKGHEVTVITRGSLRTKTEFFDGIRIIKVPFIPLYPLHVHIHGFFINNILNSMEKEFDVIHIHTPLAPVINTSLPVVTTIHGSMIENARVMKIVDLKSMGTKILTKFVSYPLILKLIECSNTITTVSNSVKSELKKYYSLEDVLITENGVDNKKFVPSDDKKNYVLYVGRLSYGKGLFDLLEIAEQICQKYDIKFYLVGKGELEKKIKKKIMKNGLKKKIRLLGNLTHDELVNVYQNASLFLFLSYYEGFPTVVLEAMSSGLPVLISDIESHKTFIENGKNGILIKKGSSNDAIEKIDILLNNADLRASLGKNARKTVEERFTWDKISQNFEEIYRNAIG